MGNILTPNSSFNFLFHYPHIILIGKENEKYYLGFIPIITPIYTLISIPFSIFFSI